MNREAEVKVVSIALLMCAEASRIEPDQRDDVYAPIPWRTIDALTAAFREGGMDPAGAAPPRPPQQDPKEA